MSFEDKIKNAKEVDITDGIFKPWEVKLIVFRARLKLRMFKLIGKIRKDI